MSSLDVPIIAVLAIGFHHKKGCQVEYCYPVLVPEAPTELPPAWRHLPALALPDGSHNYHSDTIFFHLPGLDSSAQTVYAVSCFRQIPIEHVAQKTSDMTRSSVQKSVCVVSRVPVYGRLAVKLELVTREWFRNGDFADTMLLEDAYKHLVTCPMQIDQSLEGLCAVKVTEAWRHKALLLLKLLLLQRRVVLHGGRAGQLSAFLLTLVSLLPECVQRGLTQSAVVELSRPLSPTPLVTEASNGDITDTDEKSIEKPDEASNIPGKIHNHEDRFSLDDKDIDGSQNFDCTILEPLKEEITGREKCHSIGEKYRSLKQEQTPIARDMSVDGLNNLIGAVDLADFHFPLEIFVDGYICLPYLSLQYLDLLSDPAVKGFVVGASNVLFKQKRQLFDVLVEMNEMRIDTADLGLKRQLQLTTEDLRFADHVVRHGPTQGDQWIREQFATYLVYLLRTSVLPEGSREIESYNSSFMSAFKATPAYGRWLEASGGGELEAFATIAPGHPFGGQLSVADMKLRLAHTMSSTEGGRKVTAAVASTGRAVAASSRAFGGALSQAKGALSVWWNNFTGPIPFSDSDQESQDGWEARHTCGDIIEAEEVKETSEGLEKISDAEDATEIERKEEIVKNKTLDGMCNNIGKIQVV